LLIGELPEKGDALAFARMTLSVSVHFVAPQKKATHRSAYLKSHPKAQLYIDFADFQFVRFTVSAAALNGGFGKAYALLPTDFIKKPGHSPA